MSGDDLGDLWVFAYGSLMWSPGFAFRGRHLARLSGWRRRLCVYSYIYRGTRDRPGIVFGLDAGGSCRGVAFQVGAEDHAAAIAYIRGRELVSAAYLERSLKLELDDGRNVEAITYVADPGHEQYAGSLSREACLRLVAQGVGQAGSNRDYVLSTLSFLQESGIDDAELEWMKHQLR